MNSILEFFLVMLIVLNLAFLGVGRLSTGIRLVAAQGLILGLLPLLALGDSLTLLWWLLALVAIALKGLAFPWLLSRTMRRVQIRREVEPFIGTTASLLIGLVLMLLSAFLAQHLTRSFAPSPSQVALLAVSLFLFWTGLYAVISRRKAISQVLGYLILENGVYGAGLALARHIPWLVELALLLDAFVAVLLMSVAIHHIHHEFEHTDADRLDQLRG